MLIFMTATALLQFTTHFSDAFNLVGRIGCGDYRDARTSLQVNKEVFYVHIRMRMRDSNERSRKCCRANILIQYNLAAVSLRQPQNWGTRHCWQYSKGANGKRRSAEMADAVINCILKIFPAQ